MERVRRFYELIEKRDTDGLIEEFAADDIVVETRLETYVGREGVRKMFREASGAEFDLVPERFIPAGDDRVVVLTRLRIRGQASGIQTEEELAESWHLRDDGSIRIKVSEREEALAAAGLDLSEAGS